MLLQKFPKTVSYTVIMAVIPKIKLRVFAKEFFSQFRLVQKLTEKI